MKQYIRTNEDGEKVINYDLLDMAARINFMEDAKRFASEIELGLSDTDFSDGEKAEAINSAATECAGQAFYVFTDNGDEVLVDSDTKQQWIESVIGELEERYSVSPTLMNVSERYGEHVAVSIADYRELNPDGEFSQDADGIYEMRNGRKEQIARRE